MDLLKDSTISFGIGASIGVVDWIVVRKVQLPPENVAVHVESVQDCMQAWLLARKVDEEVYFVVTLALAHDTCRSHRLKIMCRQCKGTCTYR